MSEYIRDGKKLTESSSVIFFLVTHFTQMFHIYTPKKRQKIPAFLTFSGCIKIEHWREGWCRS